MNRIPPQTNDRRGREFRAWHRELKPMASNDMARPEHGRNSNIIPSPLRGPFFVRIERERESEAGVVISQDDGWFFGSQREAIADAWDIARGFGISVETHQ